MAQMDSDATLGGDEDSATDYPRFCLDCREFFERGIPVDTGFNRTGSTGCPSCGEPSGFAYIVEEVGDARTVTGGYIPAPSRTEVVTADEARAIAPQDEE
jgi:hypothetical protein